MKNRHFEPLPVMRLIWNGQIWIWYYHKPYGTHFCGSGSTRNDISSIYRKTSGHFLKRPFWATSGYRIDSKWSNMKSASSKTLVYPFSPFLWRWIWHFRSQRAAILKIGHFEMVPALGELASIKIPIPRPKKSHCPEFGTCLQILKFSIVFME